jgi:hypothetical protein
MVQSSSGVKEHPSRRTQQTERLRKIVKAEDMVTQIDRLPTKGDVIQIWAKMSIGATRLEEKCVLEVVTSEL